MSDTERRASPRSTVGFAVVVRAGAESGSGQLKSISRLGALLESDKPYVVGTSLLLLVQIPGDVLEVRGQVVRADTAEGIHSLGIMFAPLALPTLKKLDSLLTPS